MQVTRSARSRVDALVERGVDRMVAANTAWMRRVDAGHPNPRDLSGQPWAVELVAAHERIHREWSDFVARGGDLPYIDDLLDGHQGNQSSWWKAGALIVRGRPAPPLADCLPETTEALMRVPGMLSTMLSVLGPGGELPEHTGPNSGSLRMLVGVDVPEGAGHQIEGRHVSLADGAVVLFDDSYPHAAWNRSDRPRVALLCDILRPLPFGLRAANRAVQFLRHHLTPEYHRVTTVGAEWHEALVGGGPTVDGDTTSARDRER